MKPSLATTRRWLAANFVLLLVAITLAFPFGKHYWHDLWPGARMSVETAGGIRVTYQSPKKLEPNVIRVWEDSIRSMLRCQREL